LKSYDIKPKSGTGTNKENLRKVSSPVKMFVVPPTQSTAKKESPKRLTNEKFNTTADQEFAKALSEKNATGFLTKTQQKSRARDVNHELVKILREIITLETYTEQAKQNLAMRKDFNFFDAFRMFDLKVKGNITVGELEVGFRKLGMRVTKQSIYLLIKRFDSDADGYWKYKLF
jgi:Ca2+-binding EF-hand superfamily protein